MALVPGMIETARTELGLQPALIMAKVLSENSQADLDGFLRILVLELLCLHET